MRPQEFLDESRNFSTFGNAVLLLLQCITGDGWSGLMGDCLVQPPFCDRDAGDCGSWLAVPYFVSFQVIGSFVLLNLLVAVILENFTSLGDVNHDLVSSEVTLLAFGAATADAPAASHSRGA